MAAEIDSSRRHFRTFSHETQRLRHGRISHLEMCATFAMKKLTKFQSVVVRDMSPKIVPPLSQGVPSPRQTHGSLCPPRESTSQTAARSVQPCWHSSRLRPTDTQTRRPRNVVNNTSHLITPAMRPNNTVTPRRDDKPPPPPPPIAAADLRPCADGSAVGTALVACAATVA